MAAVNINSKKLREMIENGKTFLVDFWAPWCPHCRKINPAYEQIAEQYAGVYAVGDVRTKLLRQVVTAVADGAMAVHMAEEYLAGGA